MNGYTSTNFKNDGEFLSVTDYHNFIAAAHQGDTVTLKVYKKDFEKWHLNISSLSLFEQIVSRPPNYFNFYSLRFDNKEYVGNVYEAVKKQHNDNLVLFSLLSFGLFGVGVYITIAKK